MKHHGLTLIELIVVIAIMIILSGVSLASYFQFNQRQIAMNDARNFSTVLRRVQAMAKNLVYPSGCTGLTSYKLIADNIDCSNSTCQTMSASAVCAVGGSKVIDEEQVLSKIYFTFPVDIDFKAGTGYINSAVYYDFTAPNSTSYTVRVGIDVNGNVDINEIEI